MSGPVVPSPTAKQLVAVVHASASKRTAPGEPVTVTCCQLVPEPVKRVAPPVDSPPVAHAVAPGPHVTPSSTVVTAGAVLLVTVSPSSKYRPFRSTVVCWALMISDAVAVDCRG